MKCSTSKNEQLASLKELHTPLLLLIPYTYTYVSYHTDSIVDITGCRATITITLQTAIVGNFIKSITAVLTGESCVARWAGAPLSRNSIRLAVGNTLLSHSRTVARQTLVQEQESIGNTRITFVTHKIVLTFNGKTKC